MWGEFGSGAGQFNSPYAIRPGPNGVVYVADTSNHRVQKFLFPGEDVPALSHVGVVALGLLTLGVGGLVLRQRHGPRARPQSEVPVTIESA